MFDLPNAPLDATSSRNDGSSVQHLVELGYVDPLAVARQQQREAAFLEDSLKQALRLLESGVLVGAIDLLGRLAEQSPHASGPHRLLARAYFRAGEFDAARGELRWLEMHGFEHAEFALLRATIALRRRELSEAIDQAEYARHLHDPLPAADVILGEAHYRCGEIQSAEAAYHRALDAESHSVAAFAGLAATSLRRGDFESSVDWALQALAEDMQLPAVHYRLGLALLRIGRQVEAATALEMAAQLSPQLAGPHRWLAEIYDSSDVPRAAEHCRLGREIVAHRRGERARRRA